MSPASEIFPGIPHVESPLFSSILEELDLSPEERRVAVDLNWRGFAVLDFPDDEILERIDHIKTDLTPRFDVDFSDPQSPKHGSIGRIQDAWQFDEDVRAIAANAKVMQLLSKLYGRRAFPFQTLNFPVGTQQQLHSDSIHFSCIPERFMCGVWLAMEDVHPDAGPLTYLPGSHKWPIVNNAMIGRRGWRSELDSAQTPFETAWAELVASSPEQQEVFLPRKGQALIWAANLLHGGSLQNDMRLTRWSQVTHYYFADCTYYTPAFSDEALGRLNLRTITNIATGEVEPNVYLGEEVVADSIRCRRPSWPWGPRNREHASSRI